jgi:hypothetical protein
MKKTKQDYINLLEETIDYYSNNFRSFKVDRSGTQTCLYKNPDTGHMCAVGRCLKISSFKDPDIISNSTIFDMSELIEKLLKKEYKGYNIEFWDLLQKLHDTDMYWKNPSSEKKELSKSGLKYKEKVIKKIETFF